MERARSPYKDLIDPDNKDSLASFNNKSWGNFNRAFARAHFFEVDIGIAFLERAQMNTGSINGDARRDLKEGLMGVRPPSLALAVPAMQSATNGVDKSPKERRGL